MQITDEQLEALRRSVTCHSTVLRHMKVMQQVLDSDAGGVVALTDEFNRLSRLAQEQDEKLAELLRTAGKHVAAEPLFVRRAELLDEILALNRLLLPRISGMMSLISNELAEVKSGRALVGGYKQAAPRNGGNVSSSA